MDFRREAHDALCAREDSLPTADWYMAANLGLPEVWTNLGIGLKEADPYGWRSRNSR